MFVDLPLIQRQVYTLYASTNVAHKVIVFANVFGVLFFSNISCLTYENQNRSHFNLFSQYLYFTSNASTIAHGKIFCALKRNEILRISSLSWNMLFHFFSLAESYTIYDFITNNLWKTNKNLRWAQIISHSQKSHKIKNNWILTLGILSLLQIASDNRRSRISHANILGHSRL